MCLSYTEAEQEAGTYLIRPSVHAFLATLQVGCATCADEHGQFLVHETILLLSLSTILFFFCNHGLNSIRGLTT